MSDLMTFPDTVEEFMERYKVIDTKQVYTNGAELVPIFRMKQWFEHLQAEPKWIPCSKRLPSNKEHVDDMVLVCYGNGSIRFNTCMNGNWVQGNPIAWMPLPKPYEEESDE